MTIGFSFLFFIFLPLLLQLLYSGLLCLFKLPQVKLSLDSEQCHNDDYDQVNRENATNRTNHTPSKHLLVVRRDRQRKESQVIRGQLQAHLIKILYAPCKLSIVGPNLSEVKNVNKVAQEKNMNANVWIL